MPLSFKLLILGAKIVILFETIKSIMVHKRKFLILALSRLQNKFFLHWYMYHFAMCSLCVAVNRYWLRQNKKDVGTELSLVPRIEVFALPCIVERATSKPTPICSHFSLYQYWTSCHTQYAISVKGCELTHPEDTYRCYVR